MSRSNPDGTIEADGLSVGYGDRVVLKDLNFQVREGEVFIILGRSGSGKSTLLKALIGLNPPLSGTVRIQGKDLAAAQGAERRAILRQFGVLYQSGALFGSMSVLDNVMLPLNELTDLPAKAKELVALAKLKLVGLARSAEAMPSELSGGMQKRAAIARAMALDPRILFLDEPSVGLDPTTSAELDLLIKELAGYFGITFVIVSHELASIYAIGSRAIMVDQKSQTIVAEGSPSDLRDHPPSSLVRDFFNRPPAKMPEASVPRPA
jgi:phospholipid/cholesterol/gamma-HCH transport system ATP-binding protein